MPFRYRSIADQRATFMDVQRPDGSTLELESGEDFFSTKKVDHPLLELVTTGHDADSEGVIDVSEPESPVPARRTKPKE